MAFGSVRAIVPAESNAPHYPFMGIVILFQLYGICIPVLSYMSPHDVLALQTMAMPLNGYGSKSNEDGVNFNVEYV